MTRLRRSLVIALASLLAALSVGVLAACGSSDSSDSQSATDVLADTFGPGKKINSGKLDVSVSIKPKTGTASSFALTGPFQSQGSGKLPKFDLSLNIGYSGQSLTAGLTSTGTQGFVSLNGTAYELSASQYKQFSDGYTSAQSKASASQKNTPTLQKLGIDPRGWLTSPTIVGSEDVGGVETIHISAGVSVPKLVADISKLLTKASSLGLGGATTGQAVPKSLTPAQKNAVVKAVTGVKVDIFTGKDDKTLRRAVVVLSLKSPDGKNVGGFTQGVVTISVTISDLNEPQTITPPANPKPFSELQSQLGDLLGGLTGTGGSGSGSDSGSADSGAASASKYLECVQQAGKDLAKVQACAKLVGQ